MTLLKNEKSLIPVKDLEKTKIAVLSLGTGEETNFDKILDFYGKTDHFRIPRNAKEATVNSTFKKLEKYDLIICAIYFNRMPDYTQLRKLNLSKKVILCFFTSPYAMRNFRQNIASSEAVVMAYENTIFSQEAAAQLIMGGIPAKGKLPVTVPGLFKSGTGLNTIKTRLSYFSPLEVGISPDKLQKIDQIARNGLKEKAYPGCQILVAKNGVVVYNKSFGYFDYANTHPVENTDIYDLASITKATATLASIMKLYDNNKIKLQDKLSAYVPVLKNTDKENITIKNALFHQSGLMPYLPFYQMIIDETSYTGSLYSSKRNLVYRILYDENKYIRTDFEFKPDLVSNTPKPGYGIPVAKNFFLNNKFKSMILDEIAGSKLRTKSRYVYSDLNFMLLKEVVENVSKRKLDEFAENEIFAGLGANYTFFNPLRKIDTLKIAPTDDDKFLRGQILIGFVEDEAAALMGGVAGHAGLFSNTNDLAKLLQMYLNGGSYGGKQFFSEATCKLFTKTQSPISRRGLGFDKPEKKNVSSSPAGKLAPASTYGHTGYTGTCFWVDPDNQLIYIFLSNRVYPYRGNKKLSRMNIRTDIQDAIYEAIQ
jgi:CubicO group peptidase (beta-lactamase class C family)